MEDVTARTFAGDVCAPLSEEMWWVDVGTELSEGDWAEY